MNSISENGSVQHNRADSSEDMGYQKVKVMTAYFGVDTVNNAQRFGKKSLLNNGLKKRGGSGPPTSNMMLTLPTKCLILGRGILRKVFDWGLPIDNKYYALKVV